MTNAHHNREQAHRMFTAGMTPAQIAAEFPAAYRCTDGKLGLVYDAAATVALHRADRIAAECGLKEARLMVSSVAVAQVLGERAATA
jgi:hypothetical protein